MQGHRPILGPFRRQRLTEADPFVASIVRILARNLRAANDQLEGLMGQVLAVSAIKAREIAPNSDTQTLAGEG